jgi:hypothetical protein
MFCGAVLLGMATTVIPRFITHYGSIVLFALFGLKMLHEGMATTATTTHMSATMS